MTAEDGRATWRGAYRHLLDRGNGPIQSAVQAPFLAFLASMNHELEAALEKEREDGQEVERW